MRGFLVLAAAPLLLAATGADRFNYRCHELMHMGPGDLKREVVYSVDRTTGRVCGFGCGPIVKSGETMVLEQSDTVVKAAGGQILHTKADVRVNQKTGALNGFKGISSHQGPFDAKRDFVTTLTGQCDKAPYDPNSSPLPPVSAPPGSPPAASPSRASGIAPPPSARPPP